MAPSNIVVPGIARCIMDHLRLLRLARILLRRRCECVSKCAHGHTY
jgi:hypothetical protein